MSNPLDSDTLDRTALAALVTIAEQARTGELTGPEARKRLLHAARVVDSLRETYHQKTARLTTTMLVGDISPVIWELRMARAAREELARTGQREVMS